MTRKIVITGLGAVSAFGIGVDKFWQGLVNGEPAISALTFADPLKMKKGYTLNDYDESEHFSAQDLPLLDRFSQLAILASRDAVTNSQLDAGDIEKAAVIIGSGNGGKHSDEEGYRRLYKENNPRVSPLIIPKGMHSAVASNVSLYLEASGPTFSIASACSSGSHSIITGAMMIQQGLVDTAVVGGSDAPFSYGILKAWDALRIVSNDACRPFSKNRSGIILGEGAGIMVLESEEHARRRGAKIYAEIAGYGMTSDASHMTHPDFAGIKSAIRNMLRSGDLSTDDIDHINSHGTGTAVNDRIESRAILETYGSTASQIPVTSIKPLVGHSLGAASAMELVTTALTLEHGIIPPLINHVENDPECALNLVKDAARETEINCAVSHSFAFGGLNTVVSLRKY